MNKYKYTDVTSSSKKTDEGMSLLALLFFMMGAVNVYGHLQGSDNQVTRSTNNDINGLLKVDCCSNVYCRVMELFVI